MASELDTGRRQSARTRLKALLGSTRSGRALLAVYWRLREDRDVNDGSCLTPGFQAVCVYRLGAWLRTAPPALRWPGEVIYTPLSVWMRNFYGIELPRTASIGRRLRISHQHGVIVHPHAVIGDDCVLRHNVTIGGVLSHHDGPVLGHRVDVAVGAVILGRVTIGDDARIGPNAVVTSDVPAGATAFAMPARVIHASACRSSPPGEGRRINASGPGIDD